MPFTSCYTSLCLYLASVPVTIKGGPSAPEVKSVPKHKKNPDVGEKKTVYSSNILVDQEDAQSFEDQEEVSNLNFYVYLSNCRIGHSDGLG